MLLCERHGDDDSFSWKLGVDRGLKDLEDSSVIRIPRIYRFIMKFVTPTLLLAIFLAWLAQNIWVKQAAPIEALGRGNMGRSFPWGFWRLMPCFCFSSPWRPEGIRCTTVRDRRGKDCADARFPQSAASWEAIRRLDRSRI
ncbi:hypothetical protein M5E88_12285 [Akkermansia muciniphila]|nr:hypothetical protein M5E88_12285 [Akkermansia muciniphila]